MADKSISHSVPNEVLVLILKYLDAVSLTRTRSTCRVYRDIITSSCNDIWKSLHDEKWPNGKRTHSRLRNENTTWSRIGWMVNSTAENSSDEGSSTDVATEVNWHREFMKRARLDASVFRRIMSLDINRSTENTIWFSLMQDGEDIIDKIKSILFEHRQTPNPELCRTCEMVLNGIARCTAYQEWRYLNEMGREANIEDGAIAIAKFYQNHEKIMSSNNLHDIDRYTTEMLGNMAKIIQTRLEERLGIENVDKPNPWSTKNERKTSSSYPLMEVIEEMKLFFETGYYNDISINPFRGNESDYYNHNNSLIDCVLQTSTGIPITLAVIYTAVVRRACGIELDIIGLPGHIVVGLPHEPGAPDSQRVFVDTFHHGRILSFEEAQNIVTRYNIMFREEMVRPISHQQVWQRMVRNLVQCHSMRALTDEGGANNGNEAVNRDWMVAVPLRFFLEDLAPNISTFFQLVEAPGWCPRFC
mmetsp:Transcript_741/g.1525  ORF Transcript_741/g.1525 Transcript_741/m.1525 type:complete len:473 (-) Transcript_741:269-1687(-)